MKRIPRRWISIGASTIGILAGIVVFASHHVSGGAMTSADSTAAHPKLYGTPVVLDGIDSAFRIAIDPAGDLYVVTGQGQVLKDHGATGKPEPVTLPGLTPPQGMAGMLSAASIAFDKDGNIYFNNLDSMKILRVAPGADNPVELPFTGLRAPVTVSVDAAGNVWVPDMNRVLKLAPGAAAAAEVAPGAFSHPVGAVADSAGNLYVTNWGLDSAAFKLTPGATTPVKLNLPGATEPMGITVDKADNVYVADCKANKVFKLAAGSTTAVELPLPGIYAPNGIAVDGDGNVYVTGGTTPPITGAGGAVETKETGHVIKLPFE